MPYEGHGNILSSTVEAQDIPFFCYVGHMQKGHVSKDLYYASTSENLRLRLSTTTKLEPRKK
jgi:hypothetical protein